MKYTVLVLLLSACGGEDTITHNPDAGTDTTRPEEDGLLKSDLLRPDTSQKTDLSRDLGLPDTSPSPDSHLSDTTIDTLTADTLSPDVRSPDLSVDTLSPDSTTDTMSPDSTVDSQVVDPLWIFVRGGNHVLGQPDDSLCRETRQLPDQGKTVWVAPFKMMRHEMTILEWKLLRMNKAILWPCSDNECPVNNVSWVEAVLACNKISTRDNLPLCYFRDLDKWYQTHADITDCEGYRLPTRAEFEYAYRAGTTTEFYTGAATKCLGYTRAHNISWYRWNSEVNSFATTHHVEEKLPNAWGFYDMAGNVEEWVNDAYDSTDMVAMGGYWSSSSGQVQAGAYQPRAKRVSSITTGFRCAISF